MLNHITIMGRLTRDPELRRTGSGIPVTSFTLAVDRDIAPKGQDKETDFIDCVAWRHTAEFVNSYFTKGRMAVVDGSLQIRDWTDKQGNKRRSAEVLADHVYFADSNKESSNSQGSSYGAAPAPNYGGYGGGYAAPAGVYAAPPAPGSDFAMMDDDDEQLPF